MHIAASATTVFIATTVTSTIDSANDPIIITTATMTITATATTLLLLLLLLLLGFHSGGRGQRAGPRAPSREPRFVPVGRGSALAGKEYASRPQHDSHP